MMNPINHQTKTGCCPFLSSQDRGWENVLVEQFQHPSGEGKTQYRDEHTVCLSLAARPVHFLQIKGDKIYTGLFGKGDISITPAEMPFFARWEGEDHYLHIRIASCFIESVARETIDRSFDQLELLPEFQTRDSQIEAIAMLLLAELKQENSARRLYVESLANVLAVHLLRQYAAAKPHLPIYEGGLPQRQLMQVLDYINDALSQDIRLADLAALLGISQFHFSHLFKQSIGITPYQYLLRQRVERAKQLLKQTDQPIV